MATLTPRLLQVLRLMHAGIHLEPTDKSAGAATLEFSAVSDTVRGLSVRTLEAAGWIVFDVARQRYVITETGKDEVRVRDYVNDFVREVAP